jgi:hypothetical protein
MTEDRKQRTENSGQKAEDRYMNSEVGMRKSERKLKTEDGRQIIEDRDWNMDFLPIEKKTLRNV